MLRSVLRSRSPVWVALTVVPQRWHTTQHNNNNNNCSSGGDDAATVSAPRRPRRVVRPAADALSDLLYHGTPASVNVARVHQPTSSSSPPPPQQQQQQVVMDEPLASSLPQQDDATSVEASSQADAENVVHAEKDARHDDDNDDDDDDVFADLTEAQRRLVLAEHQRWSYAPIDEVVEKVMYYLRATVRPTLVSAEEEHTIFPVLLTRLNELSVRQMIDVIACHWCRSTLVRYGNEVKDRVRDRIAIIATAAAHQRNEAAANAVVDGENDDDDAATSSSSSSSLYVEEEEERHAKKLADPILAAAVREISAENVVAAFVVMGISGGHRKHDVALFELLGTFVAHFINEIKDAHAIVRMLTALRRAKIVPPPSFVELLARRLPILHKRDPLTALACYRAMANFSRLGHSSITTYRFLADAMTTSMVTQSKLITTTCTKTDAALAIDATTTTASSSSSSTAAETRADAVRRFRACTGGLRPSMFSRWLLVLGRCGAPHQQYLRPFVHNIIRPSMASFPPPAFTRLLNAIRTFRSTDPELLEPIIDYVCATTTTTTTSSSSATSISGAYVANRDDFLILLRILAASEAEMPANFQLFVRTTHRMFSAACVDHVTDVVDGDGDGHGHDDVVPPPPPCVLQPQHLCIVSRCVGCLRRKEHLQVEDVDVLVELISIHFAERMLSWLRMGVVQLREVDDFLQIFREHHLPDIKGVVEELTQERQAIVEDDAHVVADDATTTTTTTTCAVNDYASKLDVDVRDVFTYMLHINDANTHGSYRPVRGDVQIDFRDFLTRVSALDVLTAVDLHEMARPRSLRDTTRRFLEHSVLAKLGDEGEDVVDEINNMLVKRQPVEQTLTRDDLHKLVNLVERTPIASLRRHPVVWRFVWHKAQQLHVEPMKMMAEERLRDAPSA